MHTCELSQKTQPLVTSELPKQTRSNGVTVIRREGAHPNIVGPGVPPTTHAQSFGGRRTSKLFARDSEHPYPHPSQPPQPSPSCAQDINKAIKVLDTSCSGGLADSCNMLAKQLLRKDAKGPTPRDPPRAKALLEKGCSHNHGPSCYNLTVMLKKGDEGVPRCACVSGLCVKRLRFSLLSNCWIATIFVGGGFTSCIHCSTSGSLLLLLLFLI